MTRSAHSVHSSAKTVSVSIVVLGAALLVLAAAILFAELRTPTVWDPLGDYPVQEVTTRVPGVSGPAVYVDGTVDVVATKCNDTGEPVDVETTLTWRSVEPLGAAWHRGQSFSTRSPGCESLTFHNPVPVAMRELVEAQFRAGFTEPVWQIVGTETPVREDGSDGKRQTWRTENFRVVDR